MKAVIIGAVESTRLTLKTVAAAPGWEVAALITLPPELAARHSDFADMSSDAAAFDVPVKHAANSNAPDVLRAIEELAPDYVFVIGWSQICKPEFLEAARGRVIGYHPAALPRMRGRAVIPWTILLDEKITASTLFWIDEGVDSGPILRQHFFHLLPDETAASLYDRHQQALEAMLNEALPDLASGNPRRIVQDERYASWAAKRTPDDGLIDWSRPMVEILRLIRAVGRPYPGAFTHSGEERLVIWSAEPGIEAGRHAATPGQIIARDDTGLTICCGDGATLKATDWQMPSERKPALHSRLGRRPS